VTIVGDHGESNRRGAPRRGRPREKRSAIIVLALSI